ncbi:MAG: hypothetical protein GXY58_03535 [Planctomycetaceae bacterium]|nr:hypothetical protein [Planctomycetaceae bacterium]
MRRRDFLLTVAAAAACRTSAPRALFAGAADAGVSSVPRNADCPIPFDNTIRDRMWMWGHDAGSLSYYIPPDQGGGRIYPAAAIKYMGIPNVCMVPFTGTPRPHEYDEYARQFDDPAVKRFTWSFVHSSAEQSATIKQAALQQAAKYPNFVGLDMDDFFHGDAASFSSGTAFDVWLAGDLTNVPESQRWPVTLTVAFAAPRELDRIELIQTDWNDGNFRTKNVLIELQGEDQKWSEAGQAVMTNAPRAVTAVSVPRQTACGVRLKIVSTYDTGQTHALSVGLKRLRAFAGDKVLDLSSAEVVPSSLWGHGEFPAEAVVRPWDEAGNGVTTAPAGLSPRQVVEVQQELNTTAPKCRGQKLDLSLVWYTHQIHPSIKRHIDHVDVVYFWTWNAANLVDLEQNFQAFRAICPDVRVRLGIYMWNFDTKSVVPLELMKHQLDCAHRWLRSREVEGLIFHCTPLCDMGLEAVEYSRRWIDQHGDEELA